MKTSLVTDEDWVDRDEDAASKRSIPIRTVMNTG
jgi:hypothetical protein